MMMSRKLFACFLPVIVLATTSACSKVDAPPQKAMSPDENLNCAALFFAVNNLMEIDDSDAEAVAIKSNALGAATRFGTAYANAKGLSSDAVIGEMKMKAYRMLGKIPGGEILSERKILERAKSCIS